ncbi:MAG: hypothetical protein J0L93_05840 [Deltaproteobacteria bacterium]|nr:hypothetical protein [Deltaproteobacteria bacterium]
MKTLFLTLFTNFIFISSLSAGGGDADYTAEINGLRDRSRIYIEESSKLLRDMYFAEQGLDNLRYEGELLKQSLSNHPSVIGISNDKDVQDLQKIIHESVYVNRNLNIVRDALARINKSQVQLASTNQVELQATMNSTLSNWENNLRKLDRDLSEQARLFEEASQAWLLLRHDKHDAENFQQIRSRLIQVEGESSLRFWRIQLAHLKFEAIRAARDLDDMKTAWQLAKSYQIFMSLAPLGAMDALSLKSHQEAVNEFTKEHQVEFDKLIEQLRKFSKSAMRDELENFPKIQIALSLSYLNADAPVEKKEEAKPDPVKPEPVKPEPVPPNEPNANPPATERSFEGGTANVSAGDKVVEVKHDVAGPEDAVGDGKHWDFYFDSNGDGNFADGVSAPGGEKFKEQVEGGLKDSVHSTLGGGGGNGGNGRDGKVDTGAQGQAEKLRDAMDRTRPNVKGAQQSKEFNRLQDEVDRFARIVGSMDAQNGEKLKSVKSLIGECKDLQQKIFDTSYQLPSLIELSEELITRSKAFQDPSSPESKQKAKDLEQFKKDIEKIDEYINLGPTLVGEVGTFVIETPAILIPKVGHLIEIAIQQVDKVLKANEGNEILKEFTGVSPTEAMRKGLEYFRGQLKKTKGEKEKEEIEKEMEYLHRSLENIKKISDILKIKTPELDELLKNWKKP